MVFLLAALILVLLAVVGIIQAMRKCSMSLSKRQRGKIEGMTAFLKFESAIRVAGGDHFGHP
jgi:hypothetical protein